MMIPELHSAFLDFRRDMDPAFSRRMDGREELVDRLAEVRRLKRQNPKFDALLRREVQHGYRGTL